MSDSPSNSTAPLAQQSIIIIQVTVGIPPAQPSPLPPAPAPFSYPAPPTVQPAARNSEPAKENKSWLQRIYWIVGIGGVVITAAIAIYRLWKHLTA